MENVRNETSRQSDKGPQNVHKNHMLAEPQAELNLYRNSLIDFDQINFFAISVYS